MSSGGDNPDDSKGKSKAVPTGRVQRFAKVAKLAGGMLAEGTRAIRAGKGCVAKLADPARQSILAYPKYPVSEKI